LFAVKRQTDYLQQLQAFFLAGAFFAVVFFATFFTAAFFTGAFFAVAFFVTFLAIVISPFWVRTHSNQAASNR
jgi:hypothetical protein